MSMDPVTHFEMPAKDRKRVSKFYSDVFGWKMQQLGPEMGDYLLAHTAPTDEKGMNKTPGTINGGFFQYKDEPGFKEPHLVLAVKDLNGSMEKVKKSGGKIIGEVMDIPGVGKYSSFMDTEGNRVGMLQPMMRG